MSLYEYLMEKHEKLQKEADRFKEKLDKHDQEVKDQIKRFNDLEKKYFGENGPTGHGDVCYSDADPGL